MRARSSLRIRPAPVAPLPLRRGSQGVRFSMAEVSDFRRPLTLGTPAAHRSSSGGATRTSRLTSPPSSPRGSRNTTSAFRYALHRFGRPSGLPRLSVESRSSVPAPTARLLPSGCPQAATMTSHRGGRRRNRWTAMEALLGPVTEWKR